MIPASTKGGGVAQAFPDVCKTPTPAGPVPIPYPNIGQLAQATKTSAKVKIVDKETVTTNSEIPSSQGDNAGSAMGVKSSTVMQKITFTKGSAKVKAEGHPVVYHFSSTMHNGASANCPGSVIAPSQMKVFVAP